MGDTHVRNVFLALVAAVRRREFFAEDDRFAHQLFHYSVGSRRDYMRLVRLSSIRGLTPQQAGAEHPTEGACVSSCVPAAFTTQSSTATPHPSGGCPRVHNGV